MSKSLTNPDHLFTDGVPIDPRAGEPSTVESVWVSRKTGDGSLSRTEGWTDQVSQEHLTPNDGRYDTRTTFYYSGTGPSRDRHQLHRDPEDRRSWSTLAKWNDGVGEPDRNDQNNKADVFRWVQTFTGFLELPSYQRNRVHYVIDNLELSEFNPFPTEEVIVGAISLVVDAEEDAEQEDWDVDDWIIYRDDFSQLMDDLEMSQSNLWTIRRMVQQESEYFE